MQALDPQTNAPRGDLEHIEQALGLPRHSVAAVERRANGDYAIVLDAARIRRHVALRRIRYHEVRWLAGRRVLRLPRKRVHGYRPNSPAAAPRDLRARRRANQRRFALRLMMEWSPWLPIVDAALMEHGDLGVIDDFRAAIIRASHRGTARQAQAEPGRAA